jgi:hypothetical protein
LIMKAQHFFSFILFYYIFFTSFTHTSDRPVSFLFPFSCPLEALQHARLRECHGRHIPTIAAWGSYSMTLAQHLAAHFTISLLRRR